MMALRSTYQPPLEWGGSLAPRDLHQPGPGLRGPCRCRGPGLPIHLSPDHPHSKQSPPGCSQHSLAHTHLRRGPSSLSLLPGTPAAPQAEGPCLPMHRQAPSGAASRPPSLPGTVWHHREAEAGSRMAAGWLWWQGQKAGTLPEGLGHHSMGGFTNPTTAPTAQTRAGWGLLSPQTLLAPCVHIQHPTRVCSLRAPALASCCGSELPAQSGDALAGGRKRPGSCPRGHSPM